MPVYEFACSKCGKKLEMLVKLGTKKEPVCDMCGKPMKRVMSAPAFILVGSGWSRDNYGLNPNAKSKKEKKLMVRRGFRGWEIEYEDGSKIDEDQADWKSISKNNIARLTLHFDGRQWNLSGKQNYIQKKNGSAIPGVQDSFRIESRSIGYYEANTKIMYTVNENTGKMKMEVRELN